LPQPISHRHGPEVLQPARLVELAGRRDLEALRVHAAATVSMIHPQAIAPMTQIAARFAASPIGTTLLRPARSR